MCDDQSIETPESEARPWRGDAPAPAPAPATTGMVCHAPGDSCRGCAHYRGEAPVCEHAADHQPQERHIEDCQADSAPMASQPIATPADNKLAAMTPSRAQFFMERFRKEEKLLGPNEQAAVAYVIAMPEAASQPASIEASEAASLSDDDMRELRKAADMCGLSQEFAALELRAVQPATAPVVPAGWPTADMTMAFAEVFNVRDQKATFPPAFRAALAAAPAAPVVPQPAAQQGEAVARCELVTSCKSCRHALGRQSCALARRDFDGGRPAAPPDWCPLPIYTAPPARQAVALTDAQRAALWSATTFRGNGGQLDWFVEGTRAAERFHGITPAGGEG